MVPDPQNIPIPRRHPEKAIDETPYDDIKAVVEKWAARGVMIRSVHPSFVDTSRLDKSRYTMLSLDMEVRV